MIEFSCPTCRTLLSMPDATAGQKTPCMTCGGSVSIPWPPGRDAPPEKEERPPRRSRRSPREDDDYDNRRRPRDDEDDYEVRGRRGFRCPHCRSTERPIIRNEMSETGLILLICLLVAFFPLFWIGFLMRENMKYCSDCGAKLGKSL
jgi:hypothetical protein